MAPRRLVLILVWLAAAGPLCWPQSASPTAQIEVDYNHAEAAFPPVWNAFGYDEPNYTYAANGEKLLRELAALSPEPPYIRVHNLLTSGDGSSSLKWGSTNVYTEDANGKPVYSWTILDHIFDTFRAAGVKPLVEIGFMPQALSTHPEPYRHNFPEGSIYTGWAYPPKDYHRWSEVVYEFARHLRQRYGDAEVRTWRWEVWNEPDIDYWKGTPEEYFKLYDFAVAGVRRAFPEAQVGGPDSTGPNSPKAADFLRAFLEHCAHGTNSATGKRGAPLDFVSFHVKGSPVWMGDHVRMGIGTQLTGVKNGFEIVKSFPEWRNLPIVLGESDPEGCAACSARTHPQNSYRNGPLFASYTAEMLSGILGLAQREGMQLASVVTWSFEFEGQPYFEGFRELATNGVDKPVLNGFRMLGLMGGQRVAVRSSGALPDEAVVTIGVRGEPDIRAIATRSSHSVEVLIWNYHDEDLPAPDASVDLVIRGLPENARSALLEHFRIDSDYSNAFSAWKKMGRPQAPIAEQHAELEKAGQLQMIGSPAWITMEHAEADLHFPLPRASVSLVRLAW